MVVEIQKRQSAEFREREREAQAKALKRQCPEVRERSSGYGSETSMS